jgi:hypothetical protein
LLAARTPNLSKKNFFLKVKCARTARPAGQDYETKDYEERETKSGDLAMCQNKKIIGIFDASREQTLQMTV